jgi:hypothetical protein
MPDRGGTAPFVWIAACGDPSAALSSRLKICLHRRLHGPPENTKPTAKVG